MIANVIPNAINVLAGLFLTYASLIRPGWIEGRMGPLLAVAVLLFVMALWSRRTDHHPWQSNTIIVMAVLLLIIGLLQVGTYSQLTFWGTFWAGAISAVVALWAALYHPKKAQ